MKKLFIIVFTLLVAGSAIAQNNPIDKIPFEVKKDNRIYIVCKVNETDSLTFLFDTGANGTVINSYIIGKRINLNLDKEKENNGAHGVHKVKISSGNALQFGNLKKENLDLLSIDYGAGQFDGIFGTNIIDKYIVEIDYDKKELRFYEPKDYVYPDKNSLYQKFKMGTASKGNLYTLKTSIILDGKKYKGNFVLDTGGDGEISLSQPFVDKYSFDTKMKAIAKATSTGSEGVSVESPIVILPEIQLNNLHFYNIPSILYTTGKGGFIKTDRAGSFGNNFLKRFNIILDIPNMQVFLKPNNLLHQPYYDFLVK
ncbi:retropepsin-like aspartic protease [Sphingobacterium lactis]|uniref:retropepsin-like aspartic protease n=1 Tax=Sphingobacterium lactis TaxID=797291 RepID=UPI003DA3E04C